MMTDRTDYPDRETFAAALAHVLHRACARAIADRGGAWIALSGGRTPLPAYRRFAATELDWSRVTAIPTDERCVPRGHPASNHGALVDCFGVAGGITLPPLTVPDGDPGRSLVQAGALLDANPAPFDCVLFGMGGDAHVASLFPGADGLAAALDPAGTDAVIRVDPEPLPPEAPYPRISLTLSRLLCAREVHLAVTGADKRAVLERAMAGGDPLRQPVVALLHAPDARVHLHWAA